MKTVNIRELTHHFAAYLNAVKKGERIVVMERNSPVAELIPHNKNISQPGWKRPIVKIKVKGPSFSDTVSRMRQEEKA